MKMATGRSSSGPMGCLFLPGLASEARNGRAQAPGGRPSWTLAVFEGGREAFYLLSEYAPSECSWDPEARTWNFGGTTITHVEHEGTVALTVNFDARAPGFPGHLTGSLSLQGALRKSPSQQDRAPDHSWEPICLGGARGSLNITCGDYEASIDGRIYYDRNAGDRPLHELGIRDWFWGRFPMSDHELVVYLLNGDDGHDENYVLRIQPDGQLTQVGDAVTSYQRYATTFYGSRYPTQITVTHEEHDPIAITLQAPMDDSPFYRRFVARCHADGRDIPGVFEHVLPHAIDPSWMRPLVHMRIHQTQNANSMWLPLFSGPKRGRWGRLLQSWLPARGEQP